MVRGDELGREGERGQVGVVTLSVAHVEGRVLSVGVVRRVHQRWWLHVRRGRVAGLGKGRRWIVVGITR